MKARINKKNETVTLTVNSDELWHIRCALSEIAKHYSDIECHNLAREAWDIRDVTDKPFEYLYRDVL